MYFTLFDLRTMFSTTVFTIDNAVIVFEGRAGTGNEIHLAGKQDGV